MLMEVINISINSQMRAVALNDNIKQILVSSQNMKIPSEKFLLSAWELSYSIVIVNPLIILLFYYLYRAL